MEVIPVRHSAQRDVSDNVIKDFWDAPKYSSGDADCLFLLSKYSAFTARSNLINVFQKILEINIWKEYLNNVPLNNHKLLKIFFLMDLLRISNWY